MDALLDPVRDALEGQIDFQGQYLSELLTTVLLSFVGFIAFFLGFLTQDITKTLWSGLIGSAVVFVAIVPPWPWLNKKSESWLPPSAVHGAIRVE